MLSRDEDADNRYESNQFVKILVSQKGMTRYHFLQNIRLAQKSVENHDTMVVCLRHELQRLVHQESNAREHLFSQWQILGFFVVALHFGLDLELLCEHSVHGKFASKILISVLDGLVDLP